MDLSPAVAATGLLLVFVLPGYTLTKAIFPEWRVRGVEAGLRAVAIGSLTLTLSVATTVLVGFALLQLPGAGFATTWSNPTLEVTLALVAAGALVVGIWRGAYAREPPPAPPPEPSPGSDDGWQLIGRLEEIDRERRRTRHELRKVGETAPEGQRWRDALTRLDEEARVIREKREAEYEG